MCDIGKLKGKIIENGLNQEKLSRKVGMNRSTLNRRLQDGETFTIGEVNKIVEVLNLTKEEAMAIFLSKKLS